MRRVALLAILASLAAAPSGAAAQYGPGSRSIISTEQSMGEKEVWDSLWVFGACYAGSEQSKALKFVATEPGSVEEARTYKRLFTNSDEYCLGNVTWMSIPYKYVRGAIAEGLYSKRVPVPANLAAKPIARENVHSVMETAICYAGQNPAEAKALIEKTTPRSKKEDEALAALEPHFAACLPPNLPQRLQIDSTLLRFRIAEALWRLGVMKP
jgi:hypothetical protein